MAGSEFALTAYIAVPQTAIDAQEVGDDFCFGKAWTGEGGALFQGDRWQGGVNDLIAAKQVLTDDEIAEFMQSGGPIEEMAMYASLSTYCKLGEATYPNLVDQKGTLQNGQLLGGQPSDFRESV